MRLHLTISAAALALAVATPVCSHASQRPAAVQAGPSAEDARLQAFLDAEFEQALDFTPQTATVIGRKDHSDKLNDLSEAGALKYLQWRRGSVQRLTRNFDRRQLGPEGRMNYDLWRFQLEQAELAYKYRRQEAPLYSYLESPHANLPRFLISTHVVETAADMRAYNARLRGLGPAMDQATVRSQQAAADRIRMPLFQYERIISGSRAVIVGQPFAPTGPDSPLWEGAKAKVAQLRAAGKVTPQEAQSMLDEARAALLQSVGPAYQRLIAWAQGDMAKASSGRVGALTLPHGRGYYAAQLKRNTTTDLTASQIHQLGLAEVARIQGEQNQLARSAGFADRRAYAAELARLDPPRPYTDASRAEITAISEATIARARALLPKWFGALPAYKMEVVRQAPFYEVAGGAAQAQGPNTDGSRPGRVLLHMLGDTPSRASLATLMCHEGVPGHLLQGDIAVRQVGGPEFRKASRYIAFSEGWGLYAEALCAEMGVFTDLPQTFGHLDGQLFRAARLVTDTGLHADGWTEEQAVKYLIESGGASEQQARSEARRYITMPGQATSYMVGMLRIRAARVRAEQALGPRFDIRAFHDLLVSAGGLPLTVMDSRVDEWIARQKAN